jgi:hypothetical protein
MRQVPQDSDSCNEFERVLLKDLEITQKYMLRVMGKTPGRMRDDPPRKSAEPEASGTKRSV